MDRNIASDCSHCAELRYFSTEAAAIRPDETRRSIGGRAVAAAPDLDGKLGRSPLILIVAEVT
jgi:hypothetical protein